MNLGTLEVNIMRQNKADTHQSKPIIAFYQTRLTSSANLSNKWAYLFIMWTYAMHISKRELTLIIFVSTICIMFGVYRSLKKLLTKRK